MDENRSPMDSRFNNAMFTTANELVGLLGIPMSKAEESVLKLARTTRSPRTRDDTNIDAHYIRKHKLSKEAEANLSLMKNTK